MIKFYLLVVISATVTYVYVAGHGMVLDPVNRASRWRYDTKARANYDDAQGWCGGFYGTDSVAPFLLHALKNGVNGKKNRLTAHLQFILSPSSATQWTLNGGECGYCGDDFSKPTPRAHEHGGTYGQGVIVKSYKSGGLLPVSVNLNANHLGYFYYQLCKMDGARESNECFAANPLKLVNGADKFPITTSATGWYNMTLQLPTGLTCNHCVLQWTYRVGNSWGACPNGGGALGCGPQEHFRSCSDISIK